MKRLKEVRIESMRFEAVQFNTMFNLNFEMIGFELRTSGVGSDRPTNWATTTAQFFTSFIPCYCIRSSRHCFLNWYLWLNVSILFLFRKFVKGRDSSPKARPDSTLNRYIPTSLDNSLARLAMVKLLFYLYESVRLIEINSYISHLDT